MFRQAVVIKNNIFLNPVENAFQFNKNSLRGNELDLLIWNSISYCLDSSGPWWQNGIPVERGNKAGPPGV